MKVREAMVSDPKTCTVDMSLEKAAEIMWHANCGCLPVRDATGRIVGLITDRDIAMAAYLNHRELWNLHVSDVIQGHPLYICWPDDDVRDALAIMEREGVRRLPVLDDDGALVGLLSMGDLVYIAQKGPGARRNGHLPFGDLVSALKSVFRHHAGSPA
jgi:CBS domain-containing protein